MLWHKEKLYIPGLTPDHCLNHEIYEPSHESKSSSILNRTEASRSLTLPIPPYLAATPAQTGSATPSSGPTLNSQLPPGHLEIYINYFLPRPEFSKSYHLSLNGTLLSSKQNQPWTEAAQDPGSSLQRISAWVGIDEANIPRS